MEISDYQQQESKKIENTTNAFSTLFEKGVVMIYEDALKLLSNSDVLERLTNERELPKVLTSSVIQRLLSKKKLTWESYFLPKFPEKVDINTFLQLFLSRYFKIASMLKRRPAIKAPVSIERLKKFRGREDVSIICMVREIRRLSKDKVILTVEDPTGSINVLFTKEAASLPELQEVVTDEVIAVTGSAGRGVLFGNRIYYPDFSPVAWPKGMEGKLLFISDIHVGSKKFNEDIWTNFVSYVEDIASEVRAIFIGGDLVDGTGIYQGQDAELEIEDIRGQYSQLAEYLKQLPSDIPIFLIPGNHDASSEGEPQPPVPRDLASEVYGIKNAIMLPNPVGVLIDGKLKILMYHGTSLDSVIDSIESLRNAGGSSAYLRPTLVTRVLLKKRHLSPIFGRNRIIPNAEDYLVIEEIPHVFFTGHVHTVDFAVYKGVRLVSSGTFQERTAFQEKLGHFPTVGKFVELELSSGKGKIIDLA